MSSVIDGIIFPTSPDKWAYAKQQKDLATSVAARINMAEAKATRESEAARRYVDHIATTEFGGRSAYDIAVANGFSGSESDWLLSLKGEPGEPGASGNSEVTAPTVASFITSDTAVRRELDKAYKRGFSVKEYGAVGDGVTDDTAAIQAAANAAFSAGGNSTVYFPEGNYKTTATIQIKCSIDGRNGQIQYYGTGTALIVGDTSSWVLSRKSIYLPRIINMNVSASKIYDGTSIGARLINLNSCQISFDFIQYFEEGLVCEGLSQGFVHNNILAGTLWSNRRNLIFRPTSGATIGWVNSNTVIGGRFLFEKAMGTVDDPDSSMIKFETDGNGNGPNANTFIGTSVEGPNTDLYRLQITGSYNQFYNLRYEHPHTDTVRVWWGPTSSFNLLQGGYHLARVKEVWAAGAKYSAKRPDDYTPYGKADNTTALTIPNSVATPVTWYGFAGLDVAYDSSGTVAPRPGKYRIEADVLVKFTKAAAYADIRLISGTGAILATRRFIPASTAYPMTLSVSHTGYFQPGETFSVVIFQASGEDATVANSNMFNRIQVNSVV